MDVPQLGTCNPSRQRCPQLRPTGAADYDVKKPDGGPSYSGAAHNFIPISPHGGSRHAKDAYWRRFRLIGGLLRRKGGNARMFSVNQDTQKLDTGVKPYDHAVRVQPTFSPPCISQQAHYVPDVSQPLAA